MQTPNPDSSIQIEGLIKDPSMRLSLANSSILSEKEINFVNSKFLEDIDFSYEEALARHRNIAMQNIPIWMYVLLAWFASDNVLGWLSSPILFYPLVVIGSLLFAAFQMGMMPVLLGAGLPILKAQVNGFLAKTSIPFRM